MPRRVLPFITNEIYHVFNRSVGKENIFSSRIQLRKILETISYYSYPQQLRLSKFNQLPIDVKQDYLIRLTKIRPLVNIYAFAFMPNHYHLLLKQLEDNGTKKFTTAIQNSYAKYFNTRYDRHGSLFQIQFKAKRIETDEQFLHISRYIHLNPVTSYLIEFPALSSYPWTSFQYYCSKLPVSYIDTEQIRSYFHNPEEYRNFVSDQVDYQRTLGKLKDLILE